MKRRIATGIDIGTYYVKIVVVEEVKEKGSRSLRVIGTGSAPTQGMHRGYIVNKKEVAESLRVAKHAAESISGITISSAFLSIGSVSMKEVRVTGEAIISRADQEITENDMNIALGKAYEATGDTLSNYKILHEIPIEYHVDSMRVYNRPIGMKGTRLEITYLFVTCLQSHVDALIQVAESADIEITDYTASAIAQSNVVLTRDQKMKGCVLTDIGAETVSLVVYDEGIPISVAVLEGGSSAITDDLALAFKISIEDAERIKRGRLGGAMYSGKKMDAIITRRTNALFSLVAKHLKSIRLRGLLPAGAIITGGGASNTGIVETAKRILSLPARVTDVYIMGDTSNAKFRDSTWAVAYGTAFWGLTGDTETSGRNVFAKIRTSAQRFFHNFLP
ncbi:MAG TPA: cell division protein FtsA [Candidatus Kaiserbacteria bacterium]|nr:cell division protein FtsA [Candidatus Kaiserbacteria bacterium]